MNPKLIDTPSLYAALAAKKDLLGLSWRKLSHEIKASPSTFTRLKEGRVPDLAFLLRSTQWLGVDLKAFVLQEQGRCLGSPCVSLPPPSPWEPLVHTASCPPLRPCDPPAYGIEARFGSCVLQVLIGSDWVYAFGLEVQGCVLVLATRWQEFPIGSFVCPLPPPSLLAFS